MEHFNQSSIIGVVGAGTMGIGIAQVISETGYRVLLHDVNREGLERAIGGLKLQLDRLVEKEKLSVEQATALLGRIECVTELDALGEAQWVVEAVSEDLELKQSIFRKLDRVCSADTILATNTSSLSVTAIAGSVQVPERVVGMHFFNPVPLMKLVEVIRGRATSVDVVQKTIDFARLLGKTPVTCEDTPGFIVNRVARAFYGEALRLAGEKVANFDAIDRIARDGGGMRMGPFELMDLIGLDVNLSVTESVYRATYEEPRFKPHAIQRRMVQAGDLGRKTGRGFYRYDR